MRLNNVIVVIMTSLVAATYGFGIYLFAQLVPDMRASLGFDLAYVGAVTASGQLGFLVCALLAAWLTPKIGGGFVILGSGVVCAIALLLISLSSNIFFIGALLTILAGTAATVFVPMVDVITRVVAYRYRGMAMGLVSSGTSYGVFINSVLVSAYAPQGAWRTVWWLEGLLTVIIVAAVLWVFKLGGLLGKTSSLVADSATAEVATPPSLKRADVQGELIKPWVLVVWSMNFLIGFSTFPFQTYLSSYLRAELGFGVGYTAHIWAVIGFVGMFAGLAVGWLSDKIGLRSTMILVYVCMLLAALIFVTQPSGYWLMVASVLFSTAFYPIFGLIPAYVSKLAPSISVAVAIFGVANVMQGAGGMLGNYGAGLLASMSGTFTTVYAVIVIVGLALIMLTFKLPKVIVSTTQDSLPKLS
jgi:predicted MFS family arabinose efflux permease